MKDGLYKFYLDCGRMGTVSGVFASNSSEIGKIMGKEIYFGEILGKFSDVSCVISNKNLTLLTDDSDFIQKAKQYKLVPSGHNPLDYVE